MYGDSRFHPKKETESSHRNVMFQTKYGTIDVVHDRDTYSFCKDATQSEKSSIIGTHAYFPPCVFNSDSDTSGVVWVDHFEDPVGADMGESGQMDLKHSSVRFGVFTAVTMKNVVFWDIKPQFVLHRRHITSPLRHKPVNGLSRR
jgi:hypothetical protein